ncbi:hypothetical protein ARMGADRAFT_1070675 [Armillaria gallica]|uniref:Uncharacterized protein n=1 Tax=Armillaria gallica TaxID=47427 RepID=A0A2H3EXX3_ARMGA|nr:hypothetical protein ARMGADRAFT_1070675 [Armillaria gallica]
MHNDLFVTMDYSLSFSDRQGNTASLNSSASPSISSSASEGNDTIEAEHKVYVSEVFPIIDRSTGPLRQTISNGITRVELDTAIEELQSTLSEFKKINRLALINPFKPIVINPELIVGSQTLLLRSLSYVFATTISVAEATLGLMALMSDTMEKRKANRLWGCGRSSQ